MRCVWVGGWQIDAYHYIGNLDEKPSNTEEEDGNTEEVLKKNKPVLKKTLSFIYSELCSEKEVLEIRLVTVKTEKNDVYIIPTQPLHIY